MSLIEAADNDESACNYEQALAHYQDGLDHFVKAMDGELVLSGFLSAYTLARLAERNPDLKGVIKQKITEYMARAELIKEYLQSKQRTSFSSSSSSLSTSAGSYPSSRPQASVSQAAAQYVVFVRL